MTKKKKQTLKFTYNDRSGASYEKQIKKFIKDNFIGKAEALALVEEDRRNLEYLEEKFKKNKEIVFAGVEQFADALEFAHDSLKKDKKFALEVINKYEQGVFKYFHDSLKKDREIVLEAVMENGWALEFADKSLQKDQEILANLKKDKWYRAGKGVWDDEK